MADIVNTGATANDGSGDDLRTAFQQVNLRFQVLQAGLAPDALEIVETVQGLLDEAQEAESESAASAALASAASLQAESARNEAMAARDAATVNASVYSDIAAGLAAVADGVQFQVVSADGGTINRYRRDAGPVAVLVASYPSAQIADRIDQGETVHLAITDPHGFAVAELREDAMQTGSFSVGEAGLFMNGQAVEQTGLGAMVVADEHGFVGFMVKNDGQVLLPWDEFAPWLSDAAISELNSAGLRSSANMRASLNTEVARPVWDYNQFAAYGQSLSIGQEGWPALSKTARYGNVMLGGAVRPASATADGWSSVGGSDVFVPLQANVQSSGVVLSDAAVADLAPGDQSLGEDPVVGMTNFAKLQHNRRWQVSNDTSRIFLATSSGVGGRTVEELSKGETPDRYSRLYQAISKANAAALAAGKTHGVVAVSYMQGEANYAGSGDSTLAGYKALLKQLRDDIIADVTSITGQAEPPLFMTYQTSGSYTSDTNSLAIGMAQWELSKENSNWVLATPAYPFTDKGGHLDANGYRWMGAQFGKVWHRVVELGEAWKPLSPLGAVVRELEVFINFHVPVPPLQFAQPYVVLTATDYAAKGFTVIDGAGTVPLSSVEIVSDCVIRLLLARATSGTVNVRYADKTTHNGNGCLRDSDPTVSTDLYEYSAGTGQYAAANIFDLVGKPYPLHNWCIAFHITATSA